MTNPINGRQFDAIKAELSRIAKQLEPLPQMQRDVAETREIVEAWSAMKQFARLVKWIGIISGAIVATVTAIKLGMGKIL